MYFSRYGHGDSPLGINSFRHHPHTVGITFHLFPKTGKMRRQWELALRRDGFVASDRTLLCSEHFRSEDFDRTGQNVRLQDGVVPTIFNFPAHLQRLVATRSTTTSRRAEDNLPMDLSQDVPQPDVVTHVVIDTSTSLSAVDMSSAAGGEDLPSPFADIPALVHDHSYLPVSFNCLVDNALVYISGFVVRRALKKQSCDVCRDRRCICHQGLPPANFNKQWRSGDSIRRHSEGRQGSRVGHSSGISKYQMITAHQLKVVYIVRKKIGSEDVFVLGEHIGETQYGIDSHHHMLLTLVVSLFFKLRLHHIAKMTNLSLQSNNM